MKKYILGMLAGMSVLGASLVAIAQEALPLAQVTLTVTNFRSAASVAERRFVDASTALTPHPAVTLVDNNGLPTLVTKRAVDIELAIESADPSESYKAVSVIFEQRADGDGIKTDPDGAINFSQSQSSAGTIVIKNHFKQIGANGRYEFFVVIQRSSDGAIGIIDPVIINKPER